MTGTALIIGGVLAGTTAPAHASLPARTPSPEPVELSAVDADAWLDGLLAGAIEREGIAGAVVSIVHDGEVITERGYGWADLGRSGGDPVPVDPNATLFRIGSISKTFTATSVMQLVEAGTLDLDRPAQDYLDITLPNEFNQPITLRHLLTHTAGFEDQWAGVIGNPDAPAPSLRTSVAVDPPEQVFEPGTMPSYSNYSNALAGYIVERVTGRPYADHVKERVFGPAGMTTATMEQPLPENLRDRMSRGYDSVAGNEVPFEMVGPAPAGAISATGSDMSGYLLAHLGHPRSDTPLLSPTTFDTLHEPALGPDTLGGLANGPRMTIGFFQQDRNGHRILEHSGDLTAFHAQMQLYPDDDTGIYIALNSTGIRGEATTAIRDQVMNGFADRYFPDLRDPAGPTATSAEHGAQLAGTYLVSRRSESNFGRLFSYLSGIDITANDDDTISLTAAVHPDGTPLRFQEVEPWVWQEVDGQRRIAVDHTDGNVTSVGFNAAFTLVPMSAPARAVPLIALLSAAVLLSGIAVRPIAAGVRWTQRIRRRRTTTQRRLHIALLGASIAFAGAVICWSISATAILNDASPGDTIIRAAQILTALSILGVLPAVTLLVQQIRHRPPLTEPRRWASTTGLALTALAFIGIGYTVGIGGLLLPSISY